MKNQAATRSLLRLTQFGSCSTEGFAVAEQALRRKQSVQSKPGMKQLLPATGWWVVNTLGHLTRVNLPDTLKAKL